MKIRYVTLDSLIPVRYLKFDTFIQVVKRILCYAKAERLENY